MAIDDTTRTARTDHGPWAPPAPSSTALIDRPTTSPAAPPPSPPPADERPAQDGGRRGLPLRSYLAVALTAALGAGAVVVPTALLEDEPAPAQVEPTTTSAPVEDAAPAPAPAEPLPGAVDGSLVAAIAERLTPSVLRIDVRTAGGQGSGSGVVFDAAGHVITNNHVVADATEVSVLTPDGQRLDAEVVGTDPSTDIAVLLVDTDRQLPVPSYSDGEPAVGELAVAIGSPFGQNFSVTSGIISGLSRTLNSPDTPLFDLIQTDAAINPGNSGGALVNGRGEVIGINTAILSPSGANDGIGFAVPASTATAVAEDLIEFGEVRAGFLGVEGLTMSQDVAEQYDVEATSGAIIARVMPDGPADEASIREGDIVVAVDGEDITSMADLASLVRERDPGESITLTLLRDGERLELELTLAERP